MTRILARAETRTQRAAMNDYEAAYADFLDARVDVFGWSFECLTLRLAENLRLTPDFLVIHVGGTVYLDDVKGFWQDDARQKIKAAARLFPWFRFRGVQWIAKMSKKRRAKLMPEGLARAGQYVLGEWLYEEFQPWPKRKA